MLDHVQLVESGSDDLFDDEFIGPLRMLATLCLAPFYEVEELECGEVIVLH